MLLSVSSSSVVRILGAVAVLLVIASTVGQLSTFLLGHGRLFGFVPLFFVDNERNIPTYFSTFLMLFISLLLAVIAMLQQKHAESYAPYWAFLACGFLLMGYDEAFQVHERLIDPFRALLGDFGGNMLYFAWVVPGIALVLILALFLKRFLWQLPVATRFGFLLAGAIYLGGAIGVEMFAGRHVALYGHQNLTYSMIATVEESLEMAGLIVFIRVLLKFYGANYGEVRLQFDS